MWMVVMVDVVLTIHVILFFIYRQPAVHRVRGRTNTISVRGCYITTHFTCYTTIYTR